MNTTIKNKELLLPWKISVTFLMSIIALQFFMLLRPDAANATIFRQNAEQIKPIDVAPISKVEIATKAAPIKPKFLIPNKAEQVATTVPTKSTLPPSPPKKTEEQLRREAYANAKFLSVVETGEKIQYSKTDLFCMAKNIYHEAGSEPTLGKYAVAQVTVNRMKSPKYNDTVCGVVFQPYQFSWANYHGRRWTTPRGENWHEAKRIAREVLENGKRIKGLDDALYYHATYVRPSWAHRFDRVTRIGLHIFYEV